MAAQVVAVVAVHHPDASCDRSSDGKTTDSGSGSSGGGRNSSSSNSNSSSSSNSHRSSRNRYRSGSRRRRKADRHASRMQRTTGSGRGGRSRARSVLRELTRTPDATRPIRLLAAIRVWAKTTNTAACGNTGLLATARSDGAERHSRARRALPIRPLAVIRACASWASPSRLTSPPTSPCPRGFLVLPG